MCDRKFVAVSCVISYRKMSAVFVDDRRPSKRALRSRKTREVPRPPRALYVRL